MREPIVVDCEDGRIDLLHWHVGTIHGFVCRVTARIIGRQQTCTVNDGIQRRIGSSPIMAFNGQMRAKTGGPRPGGLSRNAALEWSRPLPAPRAQRADHRREGQAHWLLPVPGLRQRVHRLHRIILERSDIPLDRWLLAMYLDVNARKCSWQLQIFHFWQSKTAHIGVARRCAELQPIGEATREGA